ncbi:hypothetical protein D3C85_1780300 [compost metagenome]
MHRDARRLVQHDQRLVFVDDGALQTLQQPLGHRCRLVRFGQAQRRNPHDIASLELVLRLDSPLVDADLALTKDAINQRLGRTFQLGT